MPCLPSPSPPSTSQPSCPCSLSHLILTKSGMLNWWSGSPRIWTLCHPPLSWLYLEGPGCTKQPMAPWTRLCVFCFCPRGFLCHAPLGFSGPLAYSFSWGDTSSREFSWTSGLLHFCSPPSRTFSHTHCGGGYSLSLSWLSSCAGQSTSPSAPLAGHGSPARSLGCGRRPGIVSGIELLTVAPRKLVSQELRTRLRNPKVPPTFLVSFLWAVLSDQNPRPQKRQCCLLEPQISLLARILENILWEHSHAHSLTYSLWMFSCCW